MVLNRVPEEARSEVPTHLATMLSAAGLTDVPVFVVAEHDRHEGRLPAEAVAPLRAWLDALVADADARQAVVRSTLDGALASIGPRTRLVAAAADAQQAVVASLRAAVEHAYDAAKARAAEDVSDGSLLRGEVLARWQEFVGAGDLMRTLESGIGRVRDRLKAVITGRPAPVAEVQAAVVGGVETIVVAAADEAAERVRTSWAASAAGRAVLAAPGDGGQGAQAGATDLGRASRDLGRRVQDEVRAWQGHVLELVRAQGARRRFAARFLSSSVNVAGVVLMIAVFAQTGGLTGGEVLVAGGTATVSQKLLEAVFGEQAVRELATEARDDLLARMTRLLDEEARRFCHRLEAPAAAAEAGPRLLAALTDVEAVRR
jgi:hypothetical protein